MTHIGFNSAASATDAGGPCPGNGLGRADWSRVLKQKTLKTSISCAGVGLHLGKRAKMTLSPAEPNTGVAFRRVDMTARSGRIPARWSNVKDSRLCTMIGDDSGASVSTVEHLLAALSAMDVDNALIDIDGPEVPAMDGSSAPFVFLVECAGLVEQDAPRTAIRVERPVRLIRGDKSACLEPAAGFTVNFEIEFAAKAIGRQNCAYAVSAAAFKDSISRARTFGLFKDLAKMREMGLGRGGSLDNAVIVDGARVLNKGGLRYGDEFVRHKALDAIGDLALAGKRIIGAYTGVRSSHALNAALLRALFSATGAWTEVELTQGLAGAAPPRFRHPHRSAAA